MRKVALLVVPIEVWEKYEKAEANHKVLFNKRPRNKSALESPMEIDDISSLVHVMNARKAVIASASVRVVDMSVPRKTYPRDPLSR